jgi:hypothetical protein
MKTRLLALVGPVRLTSTAPLGAMMPPRRWRLIANNVLAAGFTTNINTLLDFTVRKFKEDTGALCQPGHWPP